MNTLLKLVDGLSSIPAHIAWHVADIQEYRGRQELFTHRSPNRLRRLLEHSLIQSSVSSNRLEGVEIDQERVGTVLFGCRRTVDRNEEELRGYREALTLVHERGAALPPTEETVKRLHSLSRAGVSDAEAYRDRPCDIIELSADGSARVRFSATQPDAIPGQMDRLVSLYRSILDTGAIHPLIGMAAMNLDFLCIHPFRDGNGRVSRLLLLLECYRHGLEMGRYVSLEHLIEQNKEGYYSSRESCSRGWHEGRHDPWPYIGYLLWILKQAYAEFETALDRVPPARGDKTAAVMNAVGLRPGEFRLAEIAASCPGVSLDLVRKVLKELRSAGIVECLGRGQRAVWRRTGKC